MKVMNLRWCCDGGGVSCGPVEGTFLVETQVADEGRSYYLLASQWMEYCKIEIAEQPLLDIMLEEGLDAALAQVKKLEIEHYDFERRSDDPDDYDEEDEVPSGMELYDCPELQNSRFAAAICLTMKAMEACTAMEDPGPEQAASFLEPYLGKDLKDISIPF